MPALSRPDVAELVELPARQALSGGRCDVLVVGGGPAGIAAALGAAAAGADVVLAERFGFLGGNATAALVSPWMSGHTHSPTGPIPGDARLAPTDHGEGELVVGGVNGTVVDRLVAAGGAIAPSVDNGYTVPFDPEVFKSLALDLLDESGVRFLLHALASGVVPGGPPGADGGWGVVFETKTGPVVVTARVVVDATGDGDIAVAAGAPYEIGRPEDALCQPMSLMARIAGFDHEAFAGYARTHPDQWSGVAGLGQLVAAARAAGELDVPRDDILLFAGTRADEVTMNATRVGGLLGVDVFDLTLAEAIGRRQLGQLMRFLRRAVPGFADAYLAQSGSVIGVRETRRVIGDYVLTGADIRAARRFGDAIARGSYPIDIHNPTGPGTHLENLPAGSAYDIPLRSLLPLGVDGILTSGRAISGTHEAHSSYRVTPIAMATGQAAGVCAALGARRRLAPRTVPADAVRDELGRQGALLG